MISPRMHLARRSRSQSSADFQSAVSPISNRQRVRTVEGARYATARRLEALRYSRLEICATGVGKGSQPAQIIRSAPVLGRSDARRFYRFRMIQRPSPLEDGCARGRAHSVCLLLIRPGTLTRPRTSSTRARRFPRRRSAFRVGPGGRRSTSGIGARRSACARSRAHRRSRRRSREPGTPQSR